MSEDAKAIPTCRNVYHHSKSDLNALFSLVTKCILHSLAAVKYSLATKALPGQTTFVAWSRVPTSDRICLFLAFHLGSHVVKSCLILASLSAGSRISMCLVSNIIPRKDNDVERPSKFSDASGTPNLAHKDIKMLTFCWHTVESGGPIVK